MKKKITVIGGGFVGMALSLVISEKNQVCIIDKNTRIIDSVNSRNFIFDDNDINFYLNNKNIDITGLYSLNEIEDNQDFYILCLPTDWNEAINSFDTSIIEEYISQIIKFKNKGIIIIKSTIPYGFCEKMTKKYDTDKILYSPEFLREGQAINDSKNPDRLIIGGTNSKYQDSFEQLALSFIDNEPNIFKLSNYEAEIIKLFSNTYLAMRVSFFNELDSFLLENKIQSINIINAISSDPRIGDKYNNPSFGYGGYCLPKDVKQTQKLTNSLHTGVISSISDSNENRKDFIVKKIIDMGYKNIGFYNIVMKRGSKNFRESPSIDIIDKLISKNCNIIIFEPYASEEIKNKYNIVKSIDILLDKSDIIISNRPDINITKSNKLIFTRDIFLDKND